LIEERPKYLEYCKNKGIHVTAYSCLGSTDSPLYNDADVKALAAAKGRTVQQVLSVPLPFLTKTLANKSKG
jgi:diketogulonate reductase-like aldo/keto reductase